MKTKVEFKILQEFTNNPERFAKTVEKHLNDGYVLHGDLIMTPTAKMNPISNQPEHTLMFIQPIVRHETQE